MRMTLCDEVRAHCAQVAAAARSVTIDDRRARGLRGRAAGDARPASSTTWTDPEEVARYLLTLDAINFGSGWFPTLRKRAGPLGLRHGRRGAARALRADGPWSNARAARARHRERVAAHARPAPRPRADGALRAGAALPRRLAGRAQRLDAIARRRRLGRARSPPNCRRMALFDDRGFYKRAQIVAGRPRARRRRQLRRPRPPDDLRRQPRAARAALRRRARLRGAPRRPHRRRAACCGQGPQEHEIRACAVHACELLSARLGVPPRVLDNWLWNRGQEPAYKARPRHRCRCVFY